VERVTYLKEKALRSGDDGFWDGVALNLHGFYSGVERIFEDIARTIENSLPSGAEWHSDLLAQMADEIEGVRPAVISPESHTCLDVYRGFRHVVRNVYTFNLNPARLVKLATDLLGCSQSVQNDLGRFADFLESIE
jgi:hypothetical protein